MAKTAQTADCGKICQEDDPAAEGAAPGGRRARRKKAFHRAVPNLPTGRAEAEGDRPCIKIPGGENARPPSVKPPKAAPILKPVEAAPEPEEAELPAFSDLALTEPPGAGHRRSGIRSADSDPGAGHSPAAGRA